MEASLWRMGSGALAPWGGPFALGFGASKFHISLLNAFPGLFGNLMQVPASYLVERTGRRKSLIVLSGVMTRLAWGLVILLPLITRQMAGFYALLALVLGLAVLLQQGSGRPVLCHQGGAPKAHGYRHRGAASPTVFEVDQDYGVLQLFCRAGWIPIWRIPDTGPARDAGPPCLHVLCRRTDRHPWAAVLGTCIGQA